MILFVEEELASIITEECLCVELSGFSIRAANDRPR